MCLLIHVIIISYSVLAKGVVGYNHITISVMLAISDVIWSVKMYLKQLVASKMKFMSNFTMSGVPADVRAMFEFHDKVSNIYFFKILNVSTHSSPTFQYIW